MTTSSFSEPGFAMVENQLDTVQQLTDDPAATRRRKVKRSTWQTVIWFIVLLAITAVVLYPLVWLLFATFKPNASSGRTWASCPTIPPSTTTSKCPKASPGCRWRSSS